MELVHVTDAFNSTMQILSFATKGKPKPVGNGLKWTILANPQVMEKRPTEHIVQILQQNFQRKAKD
jgi:hypothetical protein